jgi:hypothetical protein
VSTKVAARVDEFRFCATLRAVPKTGEGRNLGKQLIRIADPETLVEEH